MKVTSIRYLDAKLHHPSLRASPPVAPYRICLPPELSLLLKRRSVNKFRHRYSTLWPLSVVQRTVGYPGTSWASCLQLVNAVASLLTFWFVTLSLQQVFKVFCHQSPHSTQATDDSASSTTTRATPHHRHCDSQIMLCHLPAVTPRARQHHD